jgi:Icc-related predicted phosphoesterase
LLEAVRRVQPAVHVFGHIHGAAGIMYGWPTTYVNASVVDEAYQVVRPPVEITI